MKFSRLFVVGLGLTLMACSPAGTVNVSELDVAEEANFGPSVPLSDIRTVDVLDDRMVFKDADYALGDSARLVDAVVADGGTHVVIEPARDANVGEVMTIMDAFQSQDIPTVIKTAD